MALLPENNIVMGVPAEGDMHVVERIRLIGRDELRDDIEVTGPAILARPYQRGSHTAEVIAAAGCFR